MVYPIKEYKKDLPPTICLILSNIYNIYFCFFILYCALIFMSHLHEGKNLGKNNQIWELCSICTKERTLEKNSRIWEMCPTCTKERTLEKNSRIWELCPTCTKEITFEKNTRIWELCPTCTKEITSEKNNRIWELWQIILDNYYY